MNRQESAVLNMAKFIRAQTLLLLERIDMLDFDDEATDCEQLRMSRPKRFTRKLSARLESDITA